MGTTVGSRLSKWERLLGLRSHLKGDFRNICNYVWFIVHCTVMFKLIQYIYIYFCCFILALFLHSIEITCNVRISFIFDFLIYLFPVSNRTRAAFEILLDNKIPQYI